MFKSASGPHNLLFRLDLHEALSTKIPPNTGPSELLKLLYQPSEPRGSLERVLPVTYATTPPRIPWYFPRSFSDTTSLTHTMTAVDVQYRPSRSVRSILTHGQNATATDTGERSCDSIL